MKYALLDETGKLVGLDDIRNRINEEGWYTISDEAYNYCCIHTNNSFNIDLLKNAMDIYDVNRKSYSEENVPVIINMEALKENKSCIDEVRANRKRKNVLLCKNYIEYGIVTTLFGSRQHYTFDETDQLNYAEKEKLICDGVLSDVPIRAEDSDYYVFVSAEDFRKLYKGLIYNKYYCLFYLRVLNEYIDTINDVDKIHKMTFEVKLPDEFIEKLNNNLVQFNSYKLEV